VNNNSQSPLRYFCIILYGFNAICFGSICQNQANKIVENLLFKLIYYYFTSSMCMVEILCNLHNNLFGVLLACWLLVEPEHLALGPYILQKKLIVLDGNVYLYHIGVSHIKMSIITIVKVNLLTPW
jgi:hypothetical protein